MFFNIPRQKIKDIVAVNYQYASVLHFFGIELYNYPEETLEKVCAAKKLDVVTVVRSLEAIASNKSKGIDPSLFDLPLEVLIEYLRVMHQSFVRHKLPYMNDLIANIEASCFDQPDIAEDLKFIFPIFAEDFVRHIYEEEKEHFGFIERLKKAVEEGFSLSDMFFELQKHSIEHIMAEHLEDDDEMEGIRDLTANYALDGNTGLYTRVVYSELKAFENDLMVHSRVENEILFPKAWELEKTVFARIREKAQYN